MQDGDDSDRCGAAGWGFRADRDAQRVCESELWCDRQFHRESDGDPAFELTAGYVPPVSDAPLSCSFGDLLAKMQIKVG